MSEQTAPKSSLQSILSGAPLPVLPAFNPSWDLKQYNDIQDEWKRKLIDYLRRLIASFTAVNIVNEITQGSSFSGQFNGTLGLNAEIWLEAPWPECRDALYTGGIDGASLETKIDNASGTSIPSEAPFWTGVIPQIDLSDDGGHFVPFLQLESRLRQWLMLRLTGFLTFDYTETYDVYIRYDNGARLWLNDKLVMNDWNYEQSGGRPRDSHTSFAAIKGKKVKFRLDYMNGNSSAELIGRWSSASLSEERIPYHLFSRR